MTCGGGAVLWLDLDPTRGREQSGRRAALVIASDRYLATATTLAIVVPVTTVERGWPNHVKLRGPSLRLERPSYAMTEQPRTLDRAPVSSTAGHVDEDTMREVDTWLRDFLELW